MTVTKIRDGAKLTCAVNGRLDTITAPQLEAEVKKDLSGVSELVFDFGELQYISSAGLRVLLSVQKIMAPQGSFVITGVNEMVKEVFEVTGFADILTII